MQKPLALIVDDEVDICELLELTLNRMDINTLVAYDLKTAYKLLGENQITICLTDMRLPDGNGLDLVKKVQSHYAHIPIAMISAHGNMDTAIEALKSGAFDFVSKPVVLSELRNLVNAAIKLVKQYNPDSQASQQDDPDVQANLSSDSRGLLGHSAKIDKVRQMINKLAKSQAPIHISGESGTGKELAARQIHNQSSRQDKPFVPVNCGAIPSELMESEFFGHKRGSFTGAIKDKKGLFLAANGGTLFLDEVADLPLNMQVKLLRAIQEKSIRPVGAEQEIDIDVRIISATHKNLKALVEAELFRQDLFYRINVIELNMPALKERPEDISPLCEHLLGQLNQTGPQVSLSDQAIAALRCYSFPGNVRELENILERALTLCENHMIDKEDLNLPNIDVSTQLNTQTNLEAQINNIQDNRAEDGIAQDIAASPLLKRKGMPNKEDIVDTLETTKWNRKAAAELLGITYRQLRYRLKKFNLE